MPNIYPVATVEAKSDFLTVSDSMVAITTVASGKTAKVTTLTASNTTGTLATITAEVYRSSTSKVFIESFPVPPNGYIVFVGKDAPINLEEGDSLRLSSGTASALKAMCCYDLITPPA